MKNPKNTNKEGEHPLCTTQQYEWRKHRGWALLMTKKVVGLISTANQESHGAECGFHILAPQSRHTHHPTHPAVCRCHGSMYVDGTYILLCRVFWCSGGMAESGSAVEKIELGLFLFLPSLLPSAFRLIFVNIAGRRPSWPVWFALVPYCLDGIIARMRDESE